MQDSRVEFIQNTLEDSFKAEASIIEEEEQKEIISDIDELKTSLDNVKVVISSFNVDPVERGKVIEQFVMNNTEGSKTKKYEDLFALAGKLNSLKQGRNLNYANTEMVEQLKK